MARPRLAVVYIGDAKYHEMTLYSLASLARSHEMPLDLHILQSNYDADIDFKFSNFVSSRGHRLLVRRVSFKTPKTGPRACASIYAYISDTMFLKGAAIEALAPDYDYILYLDSDTLAFDDLRLHALYGFPEVAAACVDQTAAGAYDDAAEPQTSQRTASLFNSGLLLVNAKEWRRGGVHQRFIHCLQQHQVACPYFSACEPNDQCSLNMALAGAWRALDPKLNVQKVAMHTRTWAQARLRHYTGPSKFLPLQLHRCDHREYALLCSISRETGLPHPGAFHDGGLSYRLNGIRRWGDIRRAERALAHISPT